MSEFQSFFADLGVWNWLIAGGVFLIMELMAPGVFLIWFGVAAVTVGLVAMAIDISWQLQFAMFAALSLVAAFTAYKYMRPGEELSDRPLLNRRAEQLVGKSFVLAEAIKNGRGKVKIGDSLWRVEGPDAPEGSKVTVTQVDGTVLSVKH